jgi:LDH2 family malate/lactate/ureidoglycolate dehydrogenase
MVAAAPRSCVARKMTGSALIDTLAAAPQTPNPMYPVQALLDFSGDLLLAAGLPRDKARAVAEILVEGDLMGHTTHGLALLDPYLREIEGGTMTHEGEPSVIADAPAAVTWDGRRLPGPWLVLQAMDLAAERAAHCGTGTVVIRRCHHIACLAVYLKRATDQGLLMLLTCSDPNSASVAPFGGLGPVFTPNPIAAGFPAGNEPPVLIDISTSATTNGLTNRLHKEGGKLPAAWVIDGHGKPTDDPAALFNEPKGTILPLGGMDSGHKGYGFSLLVEALTGGLAGHGRADAREGWGATVFLQIIDPRAFGGIDAFNRQMGAVSRQCHASKPAQSGQAVRTPGERGLMLAREQREKGMNLYPSVVPALQPWAQKLKVALPKELNS